MELWAGQLSSRIHSTLCQFITSPASNGGDGLTFSLEDIARSHVTQVASMALFLQWCRECEHALLQCRYDRRALPGARVKFNMWSVSKLVVLLVRNMWKAPDEVLTLQQRTRIEALAMVRTLLQSVGPQLSI